MNGDAGRLARSPGNPQRLGGAADSDPRREYQNYIKRRGSDVGATAAEKEPAA